MGVLSRLKAMVTKAAIPAARSYSSSTVSSGRMAGASFDPMLPAYIGGGGPGGWASNHFEESKVVIGWHFCATRAIARTMAKVQPRVHAVGDRARAHLDRAGRMRRKGLISNEVYVSIKQSVGPSSEGDDSVPLPRDFGLNKLIRRPNPWQSRAQFMYQLSQQMSVTGTALMWVRRNGYKEFDQRGVPAQLFIIPTGLTIPLPPSSQFPSGAYRVMPLGAFGGGRVTENAWFDGGQEDEMWSNLMMTGGVIDGRQVTPIRWPHPLFLTDGLSAAAGGELWIDIANQLDRATWYGFKNTLRPGMILKMSAEAEEPTLSESERFDRELSSKMSGIDNTGKHMRLPKGIDIADTDRSVHELDYVSGRRAIGDNVLALHATPPVAIGIQDAGAYAAYIASLTQFSDQAIEPQCCLVGDTFEYDLAPAYGDDLELVCKAPAVNDKEYTESVLNTDYQYQIRTYNEARKERGLPPWDAKYGDLPVGTPIGEAMAREAGVEITTPPDSANSRPNGGKPPAKQAPPKPSDSKTQDKPNPTVQNRPQSGFGRARPPVKKSVGKSRRAYEVPGYFRVHAPSPIVRNGQQNGHATE